MEAGLRSRVNRGMPEEINRIVTDQLSSLLFCPTQTAVTNLAAEGIEKGVHRTGDVMYDSVLFNVELAQRASTIVSDLGLEAKRFYLATIHRAENTDEPERLEAILDALCQIDLPVVLPLHPRTRQTLGSRLEGLARRIRIIEPVGYLDMLMLERDARVVLTDSGGVQKESFWLGVPALVLRTETEWVELVDAGCNHVVGADTRAILDTIERLESVDAALPVDHPADLYGDGRASEKIVELLASGGAEPSASR